MDCTVFIVSYIILSLKWPLVPKSDAKQQFTTAGTLRSHTAHKVEGAKIMPKENVTHFPML